jgi:hypothetical protein
MGMEEGNGGGEEGIGMEEGRRELRRGEGKGVGEEGKKEGRGLRSVLNSSIFP